jgi:hypothetical protein
MDTPEDNAHRPEVLPPNAAGGVSRSSEPAAPDSEPFERVMEGMPHRVREFFMAMSRSTTSNPVFDKITTDHVTTIIQQAGDNSVRESAHRFSARKYQLAYVIIGVVAILTLVQMGHAELAIPILAALVGFAGGFGYGQSKRQ